MNHEKHSGFHIAVSGSEGRRKKRTEGEHTAYRAPAFKPPVLKNKYNFSKKHILVICSAIAAIIVIVLSVFLIHSSKKDYDSYIARAAEFYGDGDYDNALTALRKAYDTVSSDKKEECLFFMADCYEAQGNLEKAIETLKKTNSHDQRVTKRITKLQLEIVDIMEADKHKIAGEKFTEKERVIKLNGKGLKDEDIASISKFLSLEKLSLEDNSLEDIAAVSELKSLVSLNLKDNNIRDLSPLKNLSGLKALYLDNNPVKDLTPLLELTNLSHLSLRGINIQPGQLQKLSQKLPTCSVFTDAEEGKTGCTISIGGKSFSSEVSELDLSGMGLTNISAVSQCKNLSKLNISNNKISDLYAVMNLPELSILDVSDNIIGDMRPLMGLKNLTEVFASGNRVAATAAFGAMDNLEILDLSDNPIGDFSGFEKMENIHKLSLKNTGLNDEGLKYLSKLYTMGRLYIEGNPELSTDAVDALKASLPACTITHSKLFTFVNFGEIKLRSNAEVLDLSSMGLSDITPILKMSNLINVNLSSNNIDNLYFMQYTLSLTSIKRLDLSSNKISDISYLSGLSALEELNLAHNNISSVGKLVNLKNLKALDLSGNPLEKETVDELRVALGGCKVIFE